MASHQPPVFVETAARLHFGVLDLRGAHGRWFGGIGASASTPTLLVSASPSSTLTVEGDDAERAEEYARQFLTYHQIADRLSYVVGLILGDDK